MRLIIMLNFVCGLLSIPTLAWAQDTRFVAGSGGYKYIEMKQVSAGPMADFATWSLVNLDLAFEKILKDSSWVLRASESYGLARQGSMNKRFSLNDLRGEAKRPLHRFTENLRWVASLGVNWWIAPLFLTDPSGLTTTSHRSFWFAEMGTGLEYQMDRNTLALHLRYGHPLSFLTPTELESAYTLGVGGLWERSFGERWSWFISPGATWQEIDFREAFTGELSVRQYNLRVGFKVSL